MVTIEQAWDAIKSWFGSGVREDPPSYDLFGIQYQITLLYRYVYLQDPDLLGDPESEPRKTWDMGGSIEAGYIKMWNE